MRTLDERHLDVTGLLSLDSKALSICKTLEAFIKTSAFCRVRMEAMLALAQITGQENAYDGASIGRKL